MALSRQPIIEELAANRPPGPANGPFGIRHIYRLNTEPLKFYERLGSYGDIATFRMFGVRAYFLNSPQLIHPVLRDTGTRFRKLPRSLKMLSRGLGQGLLSSEGKRWQMGRRIVQPAFSTRSIAASLDGIAPCVENMLARWSQGSHVELLTELDRLTVEVASRSLLGLSLCDDASRIGAASRLLAHAWARSLRQVFPLPRWAPFSPQRGERKACALLRDTIGRLAEAAKTEVPQEANLLSRLVAAFESQTPSKFFNRERLIDHVLTLFIAAYHASAVTLSWTFYLLARHTAVRERLLDEIEWVLEERTPSLDDIRDMPFAQCVIKESMRLFPSAWEMFPRQAVETTELGRWTIPRHAWLFISPYITHRDPRFFSDPLEFDPDRWSPGRIDAIDPRAYFPFGGGRHICIGREMAMVQNTMMLVMILRAFDMKFHAHEHVPHSLPPLALVPRNPMWVTLDARPSRIGTCRTTTGVSH